MGSGESLKVAHVPLRNGQFEPVIYVLFNKRAGMFYQV